jgi:CBS-domain-containing membrane protein
MMFLLALFIYAAATSESRITALSDLLEGVTVADMVSWDVPTVSVDATVADFVDHMLRDRRTTYPVVDATGTVVGIITLDSVRRSHRRNPESTTIREIMIQDVPQISVTDDAFTALTLLGEKRAEVALVEERGTIIGVITQSDLATLLQIRQTESNGVAPRVAT